MWPLPYSSRCRRSRRRVGGGMLHACATYMSMHFEEASLPRSRPTYLHRPGNVVQQPAQAQQRRRHGQKPCRAERTCVGVERGHYELPRGVGSRPSSRFALFACNQPSTHAAIRGYPTAEMHGARPTGSTETLTRHRAACYATLALGKGSSSRQLRSWASMLSVHSMLSMAKPQMPWRGSAGGPP